MNNLFSSRSTLISTLSFLWLFIVVFGLWQVFRYDNRPGMAAPAPVRWPKTISVKQNSHLASLIMVIHPHCPCSRASLAELSQLMARSQSHLNATVVFVQYPGVTQKWVQTDTWRQAGAIPGVRVLSDFNGKIAHQLRAQTSGQTYLYDGQGHLLFSGGLTGERGMEGDNAGLSAILSVVHGQSSSRTHTPVFGCPLFPQGQSVEEAARCRR